MRLSLKPPITPYLHPHSTLGNSPQLPLVSSITHQPPLLSKTLFHSPPLSFHSPSYIFSLLSFSSSLLSLHFTVLHLFSIFLILHSSLLSLQSTFPSFFKKKCQGIDSARLLRLADSNTYWLRLQIRALYDGNAVYLLTYFSIFLRFRSPSPLPPL